MNEAVKAQKCSFYIWKQKEINLSDVTITAHVLPRILDVGMNVRKTPSFTCLCHVLWSSCFTYWPHCPPKLRMVSLCFVRTRVLKNGHDTDEMSAEQSQGASSVSLYVSNIEHKWAFDLIPKLAKQHFSNSGWVPRSLLSGQRFFLGAADLRYKSERSLQAASEETVSPAIRYLLSLIKPSGIQPYLIQRPGCTTQSTPLSDALVCYHWNQHYQIPNVLWKGGGDATFQYENTQRSLRIEEII